MEEYDDYLRKKLRVIDKIQSDMIQNTENSFFAPASDTETSDNGDEDSNHDNNNLRNNNNDNDTWTGYDYQNHHHNNIQHNNNNSNNTYVDSEIDDVRERINKKIETSSGRYSHWDPHEYCEPSGERESHSSNDDVFERIINDVSEERYESEDNQPIIRALKRTGIIDYIDNAYGEIYINTNNSNDNEINNKKLPNCAGDQYILINMQDENVKFSLIEYDDLKELTFNDLNLARQKHYFNKITTMNLLERIQSKNYPNIIVRVLSPNFKLKENRTIGNN